MSRVSSSWREPDPSAKTDLLFALADAREKVGWHGPPQIVDERWTNLRAGPKLLNEREAHEMAAPLYAWWID
jgi:hypothetical protein